MTRPPPHARSARAAVLAAAACVLAAATPLPDRDLRLLPDAPDPGPGESVRLAVRGAGGAPGGAAAREAGPIVEAFATDIRGRTDLAIAPPGDGPAAARLALRAPGTAVVAVVTDASYDETPAAAFEERLDRDGDHATRDARRRSGAAGLPGRERVTHHMKALLNARGPSASVALTRTGLAIEIVPETDLSTLAPGGALPVRVFFGGGPLADAAICAAGAGGGDGDDAGSWCGRLDGAGRARVPVAGPGWRTIRAAKMAPVRDDPKADWHSYRTTLTFHVDGPPPVTTEPSR